MYLAGVSVHRILSNHTYVGEIKYKDAICPGEYNRLVILLVEKATVWQDQLELELKNSGVKSLMEELKNE